MSDRSQLIDKLQWSSDSRASYIRSKINVLVPAQLHALRIRLGWTQKQFADEAGMKQSRVSAMEQPGAVNYNLETLVRAAAVFGLGLEVKFVPFSEMLAWENEFNQDRFDPIRINNDVAFISPSSAQIVQPISFSASTFLPLHWSTNSVGPSPTLKMLPPIAERIESVVTR